MSTDCDKFVPLLARDGVIVLEGVAGTGKTYSVDAVRRALRTFPRHPVSTTLITHLPDLLASLLTDSKGKYLFRSLSRMQWISCLSDVLKFAGSSRHNTPIRAIDRLSYVSMLPVLLARLESSVLVAPDHRLMWTLRKTYTASDDNIVTSVLVMHPSTSYEEMIGGLRKAPGESDFVWTKGHLLKSIEDACKCHEEGRDGTYLIVLDEINRCNLPSVLGELIYLIEPSRRVSLEALRRLSVELGFAESGDSKRRKMLVSRSLAMVLREAIHAYIPDNCFILGTMNSSDRSILGFDQALRRRFPPYRIEPLTVPDILRLLGPKKESPVLRNAVRAWGALNVLLRWVIGPDAMIGHSYWLSSHEQEASDPELVWRFGVLPQAIHSAESARQERFLADLFNSDVTEQALLDNYVLFREKDMFREHYKHCFRADARDNGDSVQVLLDLVRQLDWGIRLVGQGHGQKLVLAQQ